MMMTGQLVVYCSVAAALLRGGPRIAKAPRRRARAKAGAALSADGDAHAITVVDAAAIVGGSAVGGGFLAVPAIARDVGLRPAEPCSVSVVATHQLLTQVLLYLMYAIRYQHPKKPTLGGSTYTIQEVQELAWSVVPCL